LTNPDLFGIKLPICHLLAGRALPPGKFLCHSAADRLFGSQIPLSADRPNRTQSIEKNVYSAFGQRFFKAEKCFFAADREISERLSGGPTTRTRNVVIPPTSEA
jgi:hypothetical protein